MFNLIHKIDVNVKLVWNLDYLIFLWILRCMLLTANWYWRVCVSLYISSRVSIPRQIWKAMWIFPSFRDWQEPNQCRLNCNNGFELLKMILATLSSFIVTTAGWFQCSQEGAEAGFVRLYARPWRGYKSLSCLLICLIWEVLLPRACSFSLFYL